MPSPAPDARETARARLDPATASPDELLSHLCTDPATGLSPKEAAHRLSHSMTPPLYTTTAPRVADCLARAFREPVLWMLLAVSFIALFFDRVSLGLVCLLLAGGHAALCAALAHRTARIDATMQSYDAPLCRVLRNRRILRVGVNGIVPGDILLLYPGDMVPADCRLLRTDGFSVSERELDASDPTRPAILLHKDALATPASAEGCRTSPENMAFAGGVVESGFALAVVTAIGADTHLGGLVGSVRPAHGGKTATLARTVRRGLSVYNLIQVFLLLPVIALGIFTLGDRYGLLDIFLSVLALMSIALTEHLGAKAAYLSAAIRRDAATCRDADSSADIKTAQEFEKLTTVTDLFLVGTAALHDGCVHPTTLHVGNDTYRCDRPEADAYAVAAIEQLFVYARGRAALPDAESRAHSGLNAEIAELLPALCAWAEMDPEALAVKFRDIRPERDGASAVFSTVIGNERRTVRVLTSFEELPPHFGGNRDELYRLWRTAVRTGYRALFVVSDSSSDEQGTIRAMLTYAPHTCPKTAGAIRSMEAAGIRVAACLRTATDENTRLFAECGLTDTVPAHRPAPGEVERSPLVALLDGGCRAFESCTEDYMAEGIRALRESGRTVAVLSVDHEDIALLNAADIAMTCAPSCFTSAEVDFPRPAIDTLRTTDAPTGCDGFADAAVATDLMRRRADVIVRRTTSVGGGVCGVRRALLAADHLKSTVDRAFSYLLLSQCARLVLVVLSLCLGLTPMASPTILLSGAVLDTAVLLALPRLSLGHAPASRRAVTDGLTRPWVTHRRRLIAVTMAAVAPCIPVAIAHFGDVAIGADPTYYLLLCLFGLQFVILRAGCGSRFRRESVSFFISLLPVLFYVGALAAALGAGLSLLWAVVLPLVSPLVGLVSLLILDRPAPPEA